MSLDVVYRIIEVSDVFNVMSLIQELGYEVDEKTMIDNILKFNKTDLKQCSWVAEQNGKLIGCIAVSIMDNFHLPNSFLKIHSLIVSENSRKLGIGKHLMMMAEFFAKKNKCSQIELTSAIHRTDAHQFYALLQYKELTSKIMLVKSLTS